MNLKKIYDNVFVDTILKLSNCIVISFFAYIFLILIWAFVMIFAFPFLVVNSYIKYDSSNAN